MKRPNVVKAATCAVVGAVILAGCGSGSSGSASGSDGPIKVLTFGNVTGVGATPQVQFEHGVEAAVDAVNGAGGIRGRKVQLLTCDAKNNSAAAANCVAKASQEGVVAAIPPNESLDNITTPLLEKQGIPILGANPATATAQYSTTSACFIPGTFVLFPQEASALAARGVKSLSFMGPAGLQNLDTLQQAISTAASEGGAKLQSFLQIPLTATNFSSIAAQATSQDEDGSGVNALPPGYFSILSDVAQSRPGIKLTSPGFVVVDPTVLSSLGKVPAAQGLYVNNFTAFPTDTQVPGIRLYREQIAKVSKSDADYENTLYAWLGAWGAMQIIESVKSGPINAQTITAAMKHVTVRFDGVVPDWHYQYNTLGLGCVNDNQVYEGEVKITNGTASIAPLNNSKPATGISPAVIALYRKAFASYAK